MSESCVRTSWITWNKGIGRDLRPTVLCQKSVLESVVSLRVPSLSTLHVLGSDIVHRGTWADAGAGGGFADE